MTQFRHPGDVAVLRYVPQGRLRWAKPVRVVDDDAEMTVLYLAAGTNIKKPINPATGHPIDRTLSYAERFGIEYHVGDGEWRDNSVLMIAPAGAAHSFWAFWRADDWHFLGWYVNFQEPLRRTSIGFDTADQIIDLVIAPDLSSWTWKDEDEFEQACAVGRFTKRDAARIHEERDSVVSMVERHAWPLDGSWAAWRPDPDWDVPSLPSGWDTVRR